MNHHERQKIYGLLSQYYPNARQLKDKKTLTAWGFALERFPYDAVKKAVIDYAISNKYFPDLADITAGLTPVTTAPAAATVHMDKNAMLQARWTQLYRQRLREELDARALPAFSGNTGVEYAIWLGTCLEAGLDVLALCEAARRVAYSAGEVLS